MVAAAMSRPKHPARRRIWRVTPEAPMGEFVELDPAAAKGEPPIEREVRNQQGETNWVQSSFDLAFGLEVRDFVDTVPDELFEELFKAEPPRRK